MKGKTSPQRGGWYLLGGLVAMVLASFALTSSGASARRLGDGAASPANPGQTNLVISQIYGAGGNSGATYRNDFIEIFNPTASALSVAGWSVQYASATGASWQVTSLSGIIPAGGYYLVQETGGTVGIALPTPDATGGIAMAAGAGKVALVNSTTALTCGANHTTGTCIGVASLVDYVGYGATATDYEGSGPTGVPTTTNSVFRASAGCTDTDVNSSDFTVAAVSPRNSATPINPCQPTATPTNTPPGPTNTFTNTPIPTDTFTPTITPTPTATHFPSTGVVISEFRTRGPAGGNDEFIELYNLSSSSINIGGWKINGSNVAGVVSGRLTIAAGTTLLAHSHFLATNNAAGGYSGLVPGDQTYNTGVTDDGGIGLLDSSNVVIDAVGMSASTTFHEGLPLPTMVAGTNNQSYERRPGSPNGNGQDTDNNFEDFIFNSTTANPQNLSSPPEPQPTATQTNTPTRTATPTGGLRWRTSPPVTTNDLNAVAMAGDNDGWAVGDNGTVMRWNGSDFEGRIMPCPPYDCVNGEDFVSVACCADMNGDGLPDVVLVSNNRSTGHGRVYVYDYNNNSLIIIAGVSVGYTYAKRAAIMDNQRKDVALAGGGGHVLVYHGTTGTVSDISLPTPKCNPCEVTGVTCPAGSCASSIVVSTEDSSSGTGHLYRYSIASSSWTDESGPLPYQFKSVRSVDCRSSSGCSNDLWATTNHGVVFHFDGSSWSSNQVGDSNSDMPTTYNPNDCGGCTSTMHWVLEVRVQQIRMARIHRTTDGGVSWTLDYDSSSALNANRAPRGPGVDFPVLYDIGGTGIDNIWAVGTRGTILHYYDPDAPTHTPTATVTPTRTATPASGLRFRIVEVTTLNTPKLNRVSMHTSDDGYAVGDNGTLIHWDGVSWSLVSISCPPYDCVNGEDFVAVSCCADLDGDGQLDVVVASNHHGSSTSSTLYAYSAAAGLRVLAQPAFRVRAVINIGSSGEDTCCYGLMGEGGHVLILDASSGTTTDLSIPGAICNPCTVTGGACLSCIGAGEGLYVSTKGTSPTDPGHILRYGGGGGGGGGWNLEYTSPQYGFNSLRKDRCTSGLCADGLWAVGDHGTAAHFSSGTWSPVSVNGSTDDMPDVFSVSVCNPCASYAWSLQSRPAGSSSRIQRSTDQGQSWSLQYDTEQALRAHAPESPDTSFAVLFGMSGTAPDDVWAVGGNGTSPMILHYYDPSAPTHTPTNTPTATFTPTITSTPTATNTPLTNLHGHVIWQGRPPQPSSLQQVSFVLSIQNGSNPPVSIPLTTDSNGDFTARIQRSTDNGTTWHYRVKGPQWLASSGSFDLPPVGPPYDFSVEMGLMLTGDCNNDNRVTIQDVAIMKSSYGKSSGDPGYDPRADLDGNTVVNVTDYNWLKQNFGVGGSPPLSSSLR